MKKWICSILVMLTVIPMLSLTAFASGHGHGHGHESGGHSQKQCQPTGVTEVSQTVPSTGMGRTDCTKGELCTSQCSYVDENGDDICDNCANICTQCGMKKDEDGDGICDSCEHCLHYSDDNGDGVCDHRTEDAACRDTVHQNPARKRYHSGRNHGVHH